VNMQCPFYHVPTFLSCGPGLRSRYSDPLWPGRSRDRNPVGERCSALIQIGLGVLPDTYAFGTRLFLGMKQLGHGVNLTYPHTATRLKKE